MPRSLTSHLAPGFGPRLKLARENSRLSQRQLAFPGCTAAYISRLEDDARNPSMQMVVELARRLDVDPGWLATGKATTGAIGQALAEGRRFQRIFDSIMADENDGTYRLHSDDELHLANVLFREALDAVPAVAIDEMYQQDELLRLRAELADCRRRLAAAREAVS